MGVEPHEWVSALIKEAPERPLAFPPCEDTARSWKSDLTEGLRQNLVMLAP